VVEQDVGRLEEFVGEIGEGILGLFIKSDSIAALGVFKGGADFRTAGQVPAFDNKERRSRRTLVQRLKRIYNLIRRTVAFCSQPQNALFAAKQGLSDELIRQQGVIAA